MACPRCQNRVDALEAAGVEDVEQYDFAAGAPRYQCPYCGAELEQIKPPLDVASVRAGQFWHWGLKKK